MNNDNVTQFPTPKELDTYRIITKKGEEFIVQGNAILAENFVAISRDPESVEFVIQADDLERLERISDGTETVN